MVLARTMPPRTQRRRRARSISQAPKKALASLQLPLTFHSWRRALATAQLER
jgi:hypothetical protein